MIINIAENVEHFQATSNVTAVHRCTPVVKIPGELLPSLSPRSIWKNVFFFFTVLSLLRNYIILSKLPRRSLGSQIFSGELQNNVISYYWVKLISFVNFIFKKYDFLLSLNKYTLFLLNKHRNMRRNEVQRPKPRNCQWAGFPPITH